MNLNRRNSLALLAGWSVLVAVSGAMLGQVLTGVVRTDPAIVAAASVTSPSLTLAPPLTTDPTAVDPTGTTATIPDGTTTTTKTTAPRTTTSIDTAAAATVIAQTTDQARIAIGLPAVSTDVELRDYAQAWAEHMADTGSLQHSNIDTLLGVWLVVGENIASGDVAVSIAQSLLASDTHYEVMTDPAFTVDGVGVAVDEDGTLWICQVFGGLIDEVPTTTLPPTTLPSLPPTTLPEVTLPSLPDLPG